MSETAPCGCFQRDQVLERHRHWRLSLSRQQGFLGWCLIILERHETDAANLTSEETLELWSIVNRARNAIQALFQPDHFNYAFLGNVVRHVHMHVMPRYRSPREFAGRQVTDEQWGWFAIPGTEEAPPEVLDALAEALRHQMIEEGEPQ